MMVDTMTPQATRSAAGMTMPALLLRLEGAALLAGAVWFYARSGGGWLPFVALLLAPDLSALGYLAGARVGAITYNAAHTYLLPAVVAAAAMVVDDTTLLQIALIWLAHIGMDRMLGFGLRYATAKDSYLGRV